MQRHTTHYAAYDRYWTAVTPRMVDWFDRHVRGWRRRGHLAGRAGADVHRILMEVPRGSRSADHRRRRRRRRRAASRPTSSSTAGRSSGSSSPSVEISDVGRDVDAAGSSSCPAWSIVHVHTREPGFTHKEDIHTTTHAGGRRRRDDDLRHAEPRIRRRLPRRRSTTCFAMYREKSRRRLQPQPGGHPPDEIAPMAEMRHPRVQGLHGRRHRPDVPAPGRHRHARPRRPAADDGPDRADRAAVHDPPARPGADGLHRGRVSWARGENTPQGYAQAYAERDGVIWDTAIDVCCGSPRPRAARSTSRTCRPAGRSTRSAGRRRAASTSPARSTTGRRSCRSGSDVEQLGPYALSYWVPDEHRAAMWEGMRDGTIDICSSDHAPHTREEKEVGWKKMWSAHTGTPGIQYYYPLLLDAVDEGELTLERVDRDWSRSRRPRRSGWPTQGRHRGRARRRPRRRRPRQPVDDHQRRASCPVAAGRPTTDATCSAAIERTLVRGEDVYADGKVVGQPGHGRQAVAENPLLRLPERTMTDKKKFGLLLPHFGEHAEPGQAAATGRSAPRSYGFDSVWVRDHLVFEPHGEMEKPNRTFYDALTTLTAIGAVTEPIELGTGSLIPFRHPLATALMAGDDHPPRRAAAHPRLRRRHVRPRVRGDRHGRARSGRIWSAPTPRSCRRVWTENDVTYSDDNFYLRRRHDRAQAARRPAAVLVLRGTPRSARLAVEFCDGWMPGRISLATFDEADRRRCASCPRQQGRRCRRSAVIPPTSIEASREEALEYVNVPGLLAWANKAKFAVKPPSGHVRDRRGPRGAADRGSPDEAVDEVRKFERLGVEHLVFDFRFKFDRWFEQIELLGDRSAAETSMRTIGSVVAGRTDTSGAQWDKRSPVDGAVIAHVHEADEGTVDRAVRGRPRRAWTARGGAARWRSASRCSPARRGPIEERFEDFVAAEVADTGKPRAPGPRARRGPRGRQLPHLRRFVARAGQPSFLTDLADGGRALNYAVRNPLGVVAVIVPWNLPLLLLTWKVAPGARLRQRRGREAERGDAVTATLLAEVLADAALPAGAYNVVHGFGPRSAGEYLVRHPLRRRRDVHRLVRDRLGDHGRRSRPGCGRSPSSWAARTPRVVFADADLDAAVAGLTRSIFANTGQVCLCTERVYVEQPVFDEFVAAARRRRAGTAARRPGRRRDHDRPADLAPSTATRCSEYYAAAPSERRAGARRRRTSRTRPRAGRRRVDRAHAVGRAHQRRPGAARGDLRPVRRARAVQRRGRGGPRSPTTPTTDSRPRCGRPT